MNGLLLLCADAVRFMTRRPLSLKREEARQVPVFGHQEVGMARPRLLDWFHRYLVPEFRKLLVSKGWCFQFCCR